MGLCSTNKEANPLDNSFEIIESLNYFLNKSMISVTCSQKPYFMVFLSKNSNVPHITKIFTEKNHLNICVKKPQKYSILVQCILF